MPPLANPKHEAFAQRIFKGESYKSAYKALYKAHPKSAEAHGCRLVRNGKVAARVSELQGKVEKTNVLSLQEKREFLALVARTPIENVDENSPLAQSVEYDISGNTRRRLKIKMPDKLRAIELDAKLAGEMREDIVRHTGVISVEHKSIVVHIPAAIATPRKVKEIEHPGA